MADYQLRARVPQETADKLFQVIKELQEVTEVADVTTSSVTRAALESFIKEHNGDNLKVEIPVKKLSKEENEVIYQGLLKISEEIIKLKPSKNEILAKVFLGAAFELLKEKSMSI